ncbi:30S ribosome-binding factor RbfA [Helicobacter cappadocius]|uniref:Ribosome-binding factor A n=1 Tax=Helicobacter cappadocius TaxID=3063998 RepID=A0AA90Q344_9HELI|nr:MULTISPECIES: 30S ribosome-binding factor RbfA [unclassified Helicobacter]MDO7253307.1 30S ribosome-binding factor RbfA [Helicobacter sp. faydin-H75]MDP2539263.1 30S ribosome-binding factor RbfA [Helicobacter sp. faydin-H76]
MEKSIHLQRTQSVLKEMLQEAISGLSDTRVNSASVVEVVCSRGKYNADVFIHPDFYSPEEKKQVLKGLKKAEGVLREYILSVSGWYKCPKLNFCFDETLQKTKNLDEIFNQIAKEKEGKNA